MSRIYLVFLLFFISYTMSFYNSKKESIHIRIYGELPPFIIFQDIILKHIPFGYYCLTVFILDKIEGKMEPLRYFGISDCDESVIEDLKDFYFVIVDSTNNVEVLGFDIFIDVLSSEEFDEWSLDYNNISVS